MANNSSGFSIAISELDTQRFGITIAKANIGYASDVEEVLKFVGSHEADMIILRCATNAYSAIAALGDHKAILMDTLVYYELKQKGFRPYPDKGDFTIQKLDGHYAKQVSAIAEESFTGYTGHYHLDSKLDNNLCTAVYSDWAYRSCMDRRVADHVLGAFDKDHLVGFITLKRSSLDMELVLSGVKKEFHGKGIYNQLIQQGINLAFSTDVESISTSTQITNIPVQKVWIRNGFEVRNSSYTFHKWL